MWLRACVYTRRKSFIWLLLVCSGYVQQFWKMLFLFPNRLSYTKWHFYLGWVCTFQRVYTMFIGSDLFYIYIETVLRFSVFIVHASVEGVQHKARFYTSVGYTCMQDDIWNLLTGNFFFSSSVYVFILLFIYFNLNAAMFSKRHLGLSIEIKVNKNSLSKIYEDRTQEFVEKTRDLIFTHVH